MGVARKRERKCGTRRGKIALVAAASLFGCSLGAAPLTLKVLEWEGYISPFAQEFEAYAKTKGVEVQLEFVQPYITNVEQIFNAARRGEADVVTPTHNYFKMSRNRLMKTLHAFDFSKLTHYNSLSPSLTGAKYDEDGGKKYSVPLLGGSYGLAYNTQRVASAPESWEALWNPEHKGKMTLTNDQFEANLYVTMLTLGYSPESCYDIDKVEFDAPKVQAKLDALVANAGPFWGGMPEAAVMQEMDLATDYWFGVSAANATGQKWAFSKPKEGQTVWLDTLSISKDIEPEPKKLQAAYLLVDFMISPEIQKKIHDLYGSVIVNTTTPGVTMDPNFFQEEYFWQPLTDRTRNTYKKMWDEAVAKKGK